MKLSDPLRRFGPAAAALALAAGCSSSGSSPAGSSTDGPPTTASAAVARYQDTASAQTYVEFGDVAGTRALDGGSATQGPLARVFGTGEGTLAQVGTVLPGITGIDPLAASSAVTMGNPPDQVGVLYGSFDPVAIGAKLTALGYRKQSPSGGDTVWILRDDHQLDPNDQLSQDGIVDQLNVVHLSAARIVYGGASADINAALTGSHPMSSGTTVGALAGCLGAAKAAIISRASESDPSLVIGIGVTATSASDAAEELCVPTASGSAASALATNWPSYVTRTSLHLDEPWSQLLTAPQSSVVGGPDHIVRLTAKPTPGSDVSALFTALFDDDLASLIGTCPPSTGTLQKCTL